MTQKVLVVGSTGYLGRYMIQELKNAGYSVRALARSRERLGELDAIVDDVFIGEATRLDPLKYLCDDIDVVFSSLGITKQKMAVLSIDMVAPKYGKSTLKEYFLKLKNSM